MFQGEEVNGGGGRHYTLVILSKYTFNKIMIQIKEKLQPTTGVSQSFFWNLNDFYLTNYLYYNKCCNFIEVGSLHHRQAIFTC